MKVLFASDWFGPDMRRYRKAHNPHTLDEGLRKQLPSTAKVVEEDEVVEKTPTTTTLLKPKT